MQPKVIFFDAHGALLDDIETEFLAIQDVFTYLHLQVPSSLTEYLLEVELEEWDHHRLFERRGSPVSPGQLNELIDRAYASRLRFFPPQLLPGVRDILEYFHRREILTVLLSRHPEDVVSPLLNTFGINPFFGFECFGEESPVKIIKWVLKIENMGLQQPIMPGDCALVSGNPFWLRDAKRAELHTIAIVREPVPAYFPHLARPEMELDNLIKILEFFP